MPAKDWKKLLEEKVFSDNVSFLRLLFAQSRLLYEFI